MFQLIQGGASNTVSEQQAQTPSQPSPKARAVSLLAQREYSRQALQEKLEAEGQSPEALALALDQLQARGLVDDTRVAETLVNRRSGKLGGMRMRQELQAKGLSPEVVAKDAATRNRQARFLATRGFSSDVVRQVVSGLGEEET